MSSSGTDSDIWNSPRLALFMAAGFAVCILTLSSIPARQMPHAPGLWRWDKVVHAVEYALFATLVLRALTLRGYRLLASTVATVFLCSAFGALDESYQSTVPGRDSSVFDFVADSVGATFACIASAVIYSRVKREPSLQE